MTRRGPRNSPDRQAKRFRPVLNNKSGQSSQDLLNPFERLGAQTTNAKEWAVERKAEFARVERGEYAGSVVLLPLGAAVRYVVRYGWKIFPARMEEDEEGNGKKYSWMSAEH